MPVDLECDDCGRRHTIPERPDGPSIGVTNCPNCGAGSYTVRHEGLEWHPDLSVPRD